ncbi:ferredoxin [Mycobacterium avium]
MSVDSGRCQGHAMCVHVASTVFVLDDSETCAQVPDGTAPDDLADAVRDAAAACPEQAILVGG